LLVVELLDNKLYFKYLADKQLESKLCEATMNPFLFEDFVRGENEATARRLEHARRAHEAEAVGNGRRPGRIVSALTRLVPTRSPIAEPASLGLPRPANDSLGTLTPVALGGAGRTRFDDEIATDCCA